jgi:membrane protein YdbS with pleckstrin-like domain
MQSIVVKSDKAQKKVWSLMWGTVAVIASLVMIVIASIVIIFTDSFLLMTIAFSAWVLFMIMIRVWIELYHRSLEFIIDEAGVKVNKGVVWKRTIDVPLDKITKVEIVQGPLQRKREIATINIQSTGSSNKVSLVCLAGIKDYNDIRETIMKEVSA